MVIARRKSLLDSASRVLVWRSALLKSASGSNVEAPIVEGDLRMDIMICGGWRRTSPGPIGGIV